MLTRHAVVIGLIYLLIWEGLLGGLLAGVRWLSVSRWASALVEPLADVELVKTSAWSTPSSPRSLVIGVGTWLTGRRLRAFNLTGDE